MTCNVDVRDLEETSWSSPLRLYPIFSAKRTESKFTEWLNKIDAAKINQNFLEIKDISKKPRSLCLLHPTAKQFEMKLKKMK